ncbi:type II toxin-antitoxin system VapC family toxin [Phragmitibacter flavus]|uniref:Type II toxin-antitoxin system VapC family toxin n=1 Tax=Phragmitibacter flavus TaxID=2576071 RepID=A0A5R8KBY0_9BACT|nr:type II toxin-antitoxin system VapC family toxin [Phragmitibacter flavus]TLD69806.1 type II toxin-antitoxin system VapC family toxin [Phragmitibacter flavus]
MGPVNYLLDTCSFLWLAQQPTMLSPTAKAILDNPETQIFLSDVSIWEVTLKHSTGRLPLPGIPRAWIPEKIQHHQLQQISITHDALYTSGELPRLHPDPFDRLLAAQALTLGLILLSPDTPLSILGAARIW